MEARKNKGRGKGFDQSFQFEYEKSNLILKHGFGLDHNDSFIIRLSFSSMCKMNLILIIG